MNDYIQNGMERNHLGNIVKLSRQEIVSQVKNSWNEITDSRIANALRVDYMDKKCLFKKNYIAKHERLGPMVIQEIKSQEIQAGIRGLESFDDVQEVDDMIVYE